MRNSLNGTRIRQSGDLGRVKLGRRVNAALAAVVMLWPAAAIAQQSGTADVYPEMAKDRALPVIAKGLRDTLIDPGSVTNFSICYPAFKVQTKDGQLVHWNIQLLLNSKNSSGGYAGLSVKIAVFQTGKPVRIFDAGPPSQKLIATCSHVPDAELHALMNAE